jgi:hypothetical protein
VSLGPETGKGYVEFSGRTSSYNALQMQYTQRGLNLEMSRMFFASSVTLTASLDDFASDSEIQLTGSSQIGTDQLQIGQLYSAVIVLRVEKIH